MLCDLDSVKNMVCRYSDVDRTSGSIDLACAGGQQLIRANRARRLIIALVAFTYTHADVTGHLKKEISSFPQSALPRCVGTRIGVID